MSKKDSQQPEAGAVRKVALLVDCPAGAAGAVVELDAATADSLVGGGQADDNPAAVAFRESQAQG